MILLDLLLEVLNASGEHFVHLALMRTRNELIVDGLEQRLDDQFQISNKLKQRRIDAARHELGLLRLAVVLGQNFLDSFEQTFHFRLI